MHYYKRNIGDYAKKAGHLSVLEHGVYTLLLDAYYDREQAPTREEAVRVSRCRTPEELAKRATARGWPKYRVRGSLSQPVPSPYAVGEVA